MAFGPVAACAWAWLPGRVLEVVAARAGESFPRVTVATLQHGELRSLHPGCIRVAERAA